MLICHPYQFIFLKPLKAAGTSVECFLEPLCRDSEVLVDEYGPEKICLKGIVGYRGPAKRDAKYWHHMSAIQIRDMHPNYFQSYRKISIVRDPYQKAISLFLWLGPLTYLQAQELAASSPNRLRAIFLLFLQCQHNTSELLTDSPRLLIDGNLILDHVLSYEKLNLSLSHLIKELRLPLSLDRLRHLKSSGRTSNRHVLSQYFSRESLQVVNRHCDWYFSLFGYHKYEDISDLLTSSNSITRSSPP